MARIKGIEIPNEKELKYLLLIFMVLDQQHQLKY